MPVLPGSSDRALRILGCPQAQGFLFARPADPDVIGELIRTRIALADPATSFR